MATSSRLRDVVGLDSPLRTPVPYLPSAVDDDGWQAIWSNGMGGGYLTAEADSANSRVRVDLYWPGVRYATIVRVHPDGTEVEVRGGDPATMCTGWARYDYEAPLDTAVTYKATSTERSGSVVTTGEVTVSSSTEAWLKHPTKPHLNTQITIRALNQRQRQAQRSLLRPPLRKYPLVVHGVRTAHVGQIVLQTTTTSALDAVNELFDDGADLLLQLPTAWGGHHWYVAVAVSAEDRLEPMLGEELTEHIGVSFEVVGRPPGAAEGGPDNTNADLADAYQTYNQVAGAYDTNLDLSMATF